MLSHSHIYSNCRLHLAIERFETVHRFKQRTPLLPFQSRSRAPISGQIKPVCEPLSLYLKGNYLCGELFEINIQIRMHSNFSVIN